MSLLKYVTSLLLILACSKCRSQVHAQEAPCEVSLTRSKTLNNTICKGALIFEDNFDFLDWNKWSHEVTMAGGGNYEFQVYWQDAGNSFSQDGNLRLSPVKTADIYGNDYLYSGTIDLGGSCTVDWNNGCIRTGNDPYILNPVTSARLHSTSKFSFTYGTVEARAKLPAGDWLWPAIWMMPQESAYGEWPASGEIDIMESRGNRNMLINGVNIGVEQTASTMHWGPDPGHNAFPRTHWERQSTPGVGWDQDFHLYKVEWTPDYIRFFVDDVELGTVSPPGGGFYELGEFGAQGLPNVWAGGSKMAPFDRDFFLIVNLAVGGAAYFPEGTENPGGKPWANGSPTSFKEFWEARSQWEPTWWGDGSTNLMVDYVRVWAL